jgi:RNA polymerase sigma factor (sigma-70 family)
MDPDASQPPPGSRSPAADRAEPLLADPDDFGAVFDRYFSEIHGYAARRVGRDAAADIAADTFLTAFRLRRRFDPGRGTVKAWLYGIATNHLSVHHRGEMRAYRAMARAGVPDQQESHADAVLDQVAAGALRPALLRALADLNRGEREVLLLVALGGLSHADVAAALGISYGTVASRLSRARAKLRKAAGLAPPEQEEPQGQEEPPAQATPRGREGHQEDPRHG